MTNNRREPGRRKPSGNHPEKSFSGPRSSRPDIKKTSRYDKPFRKDKPAEFSKEKPTRFRKDNPAEFSKEKPTRFRKDNPAEFGKEKPTRFGKENPAQFNKDKTSGYGKERPARWNKDEPFKEKRERATDFRDPRPERFEKQRPFGSKREKYPEQGEYKPRPYTKGKPSSAREESSQKRPRPVQADMSRPIRLNKFIANAGVCSRREADKLIEAGAVTVNGVIVSELGTKVSPADKVQLGEQTLTSEKLRYILLNKPKGFITTTDDPFKRNTVMSLVERACHERIYPVGRLDRNTTGLLLFTNDGELAKRMTHPRFGVRKIYDVELEKPLTKKDMESIAAGVELEGESLVVNEIAYVDFEKNKKHIGLEIRSGQNRVVRRIFEKFGYEVMKLDRVMIGSLTKKDLPRGNWRHLTALEVRMLKRL